MPASTLPHLVNTAPAVTEGLGVSGFFCLPKLLQNLSPGASSLLCWSGHQLTVGTGLLASVCSPFLESLVWP